MYQLSLPKDLCDFREVSLPLSWIKLSASLKQFNKPRMSVFLVLLVEDPAKKNYVKLLIVERCSCLCETNLTRQRELVNRGGSNETNCHIPEKIDKLT